MDDTYVRLPYSVDTSKKRGKAAPPDDMFLENDAIDVPVTKSVDYRQLVQWESTANAFHQLFPRSDRWPEATSSVCWWCCHPFLGKPIGLPTRYREDRDVFHAMGSFCTFACAKSWVVASKKPVKHLHLLNHLFRRTTGDYSIDTAMKTAPPRETLQLFGGHLTIEQFRDAACEGGRYKILEPPLVTPAYVVAEDTDLSTVEKPNVIQRLTAMGRERNAAALRAKDQAPPESVKALSGARDRAVQSLSLGGHGTIRR